MNIMRDERGFLHIYLLGLFCIACVVIFAVLLATAAGCRKNAVASYAWFVEAADFTAHTAVMNGITAATQENAPWVRQYFDSSFSGITQTNVTGNEYDPQPGSPFPGPITLNSFTPHSRGAALPNGDRANADGYWISITVPVLIGTVPVIGEQTVDVPMFYYAEF